MSEYADKHNKTHRKERVDHVLRSTSGKVDASGYEVPGEMETQKKTGPCQPKPRAFAKGGKVEGEASHRHAGRKSRESGGETTIQMLRPSVPSSGLYGSGFSPTHAGILGQAAGMKKGGEAKGRVARADGGRAKGKTNINIIIAQKPDADAGAVPPPPSAVPPGMMPKPGLPPAAMGAMQPPGMGGPSPGPMPSQMSQGAMPRARGGRAS